jgi:hypothetical protein
LCYKGGKHFATLPLESDFFLFSTAFLELGFPLSYSKPIGESKKSLVPTSGCKAEEEGEWAQPPPAVRLFDPKAIENSIFFF